MKNFVLFILVVSVAIVGLANDSEINLKMLQSQWLQANYRLQGKAQLEAFEKLNQDSENALLQHPNSAEFLTWNGIIKLNYANAVRGIRALGLAKAARKSLTQAIDINPQALDGSALSNLGILFAKMPGWPVGFGDDEKAVELLLRGLAVNPTGIDSNYFYALYLMDNGEQGKAREYLRRAAEAPPRMDRLDADAERKKEIDAALKKLEK